jgi:hypothetical protein
VVRDSAAVPPLTLRPIGEGACRHCWRRLSFKLRWSAARFQGVVAGRSSGPRTTCLGALRAAGSLPPCFFSSSCSPRVVRESIRPGYTVKPTPSITQASAGIATSGPTAAISPFSSTMVARLSAGPDTGTIRASRIAKYRGRWGRSPPATGRETARRASRQADSPSFLEGGKRKEMALADMGNSFAPTVGPIQGLHPAPAALTWRDPRRLSGTPTTETES